MHLHENYNKGFLKQNFSDEEERQENAKILKMLSMATTDPKVRRTRQKILDFEAEMEAELDRRAVAVEFNGGVEHQTSLSRSSSTSSLTSKSSVAETSGLCHAPPSTSGGSVGGKRAVRLSPSSSKKKKTVQFSEDINGKEKDAVKSVESSETQYDKVYFDSDESEGEDDASKSSKHKNRQFLSNDDLLYDPNSDAEDQKWVDKQRRKYCRQTLPPPPGFKKNPDSNMDIGGPSSTSSTPQEDIPLPHTDAVLNCPACFTVLCMDCQRHEFYNDQYRAMFVMNCRVDRSETLTVPVKNKGKKRRGDKDKQQERNSVMQNVSSNPSDIFFPVKCTVCSSQVAVYDHDEIYHFFNCLASHP